MTPTAAWVLVALFAVLVGAAVPALVQLRRTLKTAETTLESTGRQVNEALGRLTTTLERVDRAADGLEAGVHRVSSLLEALGGIGDALRQVRTSVGALASFGSILGAALLGAFGRSSREPADGGVTSEGRSGETGA